MKRARVWIAAMVGFLGLAAWLLLYYGPPDEAERVLREAGPVETVFQPAGWMPPSIDQFRSIVQIRNTTPRACSVYIELIRLGWHEQPHPRGDEILLAPPGDPPGRVVVLLDRTNRVLVYYYRPPTPGKRFARYVKSSLGMKG
jgi:hypothetical protein